MPDEQQKPVKSKFAHLNSLFSTFMGEGASNETAAVMVQAHLLEVINSNLSSIDISLAMLAGRMPKPVAISKPGVTRNPITGVE